MTIAPAPGFAEEGRTPEGDANSQDKASQRQDSSATPERVRRNEIAVQAEFEQYGLREGLRTKRALGARCEDGRTPATYHFSDTETAWRAWANRPTPPASTFRATEPPVPWDQRTVYTRDSNKVVAMEEELRDWRARAANEQRAHSSGMVPLSVDGTAVWIEGVGTVDLLYP
jgi:hypothetical protein